MKQLSKTQMKNIQGGYNPGCVAIIGGYCALRPVNGIGACCSPMVCVPDTRGNNTGKCENSIFQ
jgi:bacteriocin-like protein